MNGNTKLNVADQAEIDLSMAYYITPPDMLH